jgi:hypothetical protein
MPYPGAIFCPFIIIALERQPYSLENTNIWFDSCGFVPILARSSPLDVKGKSVKCCLWEKVTDVEQNYAVLRPHIFRHNNDPWCTIVTTNHKLDFNLLNAVFHVLRDPGQNMQEQLPKAPGVLSRGPYKYLPCLTLLDFRDTIGISVRQTWQDTTFSFNPFLLIIEESPSYLPPGAQSN